MPVTALWPWGASGDARVPLAAAAAADVGAFAADAYVRGLWHICGLTCQAVPGTLAQLMGAALTERTLLVVEAGSLLQESSGGFAAALAQLDARYLAPAVGALRAGDIDRLRLIANDRCVSVRRGSALKFWRAPARLGSLS